MNKWFGIGRLTADPELKYTPNTGTPVARFTVAIDRDYKKEDGTREADFIKCVVFGKLAETVADNLTKGRLVAVEGRIQTSSYKASDGTKKYITEAVADKIKFLDWPKIDNNQIENRQEADEFMPVNDNEEIPFGDEDTPF
ncbi:single-stranded DNA-binding protein [Caloramator sp. CAR-1]|uniref:single-stranded DNA-binding protein n=1 Tax=Caloramator sp. CAR-1 TaxID=3062777 RepID=UPI0026E181C0|nr:single-stranded DNA-binding protein [Caloramator sp. CAR-1]MDO6353985.1 single-stranded DNA-binding protein [Caloramator sp. CAR-1]